MKIAFLNFYNGYVDRGAETFVKEVAQRLARGHKVDVFQGGPASGKEKYQVVRPLAAMSWPKAGWLTYALRIFFIDYYSRQVARFTLASLPKIWKEKYDIVVPVNGGWQVMLCRIFTWFRGEKLVVSGQSGIGYDDRWNILWRPDAFVALTESGKRWAKGGSLGVRIEKINNGVNLEKFKPDGDVAKTGLPRPIVLCVGALQPIKRVDLTVKAVAKMKKASLLVLGDGIFRERIDKLGRSLLGKRYLRKTVSYEEVDSYYRAANIFTLASVGWEAFGIAYLEALATGLPVVAPDDESRREIVGNAGLFVDPQDTEAYAEALERALEIDWGDKPRKQAEKFSWDRIAKEYEKLFQELVK